MHFNGLFEADPSKALHSSSSESQALPAAVTIAKRRPSSNILNLSSLSQNESQSQATPANSEEASEVPPDGMSTLTSPHVPLARLGNDDRTTVSFYNRMKTKVYFGPCIRVGGRHLLTILGVSLPA